MATNAVTAAALARNATGGIASLSRQDQMTIRERETQRERLGASTFSNFDALLGLQRQLSGNQSLRIRGDDRLQSLAGAAGQRNVEFEDDEAAALEAFFNPQLQANQQAAVEALAKRAGAQGLAGGAVQGRLGDFATQFIARNRANAFETALGAIGGRLNTIGGAAGAFLLQTGRLRNQGSSPAVLEASGGTTGDFLGFAGHGLRALSEFGLGADALSGIAQRQGAIFAPGGLTGRGDVAAAFEQFLNPGTAAASAFVPQRGSRDAASLSPQGRNIAMALNRTGAAEHLAGIIGSELSSVTSQAAQFSAAGTLAVQNFTREGDIASARQLAAFDPSRFANLQRALGAGVDRNAPGRLGRAEGTQFITGRNALFNQVFGR